MIPSDFIFSQQNLQDYLDCPRRFHLRYVEHLEWPAIESEPVLEQEKLIQLGHDFHVLVQQSLSGIPTEIIQENIRDNDLSRWWLHFQSLELNLGDQKSYIEEALSVPLSGFRILAKVDLILISQDQTITIYDWKTSQNEPNRLKLMQRAQTMVYLYGVTRCSQVLTQADAVDPENVQMIYWYPERPTLPIAIEYSSAQYASDELRLSNLLLEIAALNGREQFPKTENRKLCNFCRFRSLCGRGVTAGTHDEGENSADQSEESLFDIDFNSL